MSNARRPSKRSKPDKLAKRRELQRRGSAVVIVCVLVLLCLTGMIVWEMARPVPEQVGGPFALLDTKGETVTDRDFRGRYMLVYFGYTFCPDACPMTLHEMSLAMEYLGEKSSRVQPVFVTVDPKRDTPAILRAYVNAINPHFVALTGSDEAVAAMLRTYRVQRAIHQTPNHPGDYFVDHSSVLYLMGPDGRLVAPLRADEAGEKMAHEIARYVS